MMKRQYLPFVQLMFQGRIQISVWTSSYHSSYQKGSMQSGIPEEKIIFQLHNNIRTSTIDDELKLLDEFGAFSLDGNGNSVHPKQLFTSREVVKQIEQSENMNLNLAYIGTTQQRTRSLLRSMKENKSVAKKIDKCMYYRRMGR